MNWPQLRFIEFNKNRREDLFKNLSVDGFQELLSNEGIIYTRDHCGKEIEFDSIGKPVHEDTVATLIADIRRIKDDCGESNQENRREFDQRASERILREGINEHQGWKAPVWAFLQVSLFDVVHWRWARDQQNRDAVGGEIAEDRLFSRPLNRGCLSRLWLWNNILLDPENAENNRELIENLQEDHRVAIIERTTVSSDRRLALKIARRHHSGANELPTGLSPAKVLRRVMKLVILKMAAVEPFALDDDALEGFVNDCFAEATNGANWRN